MGGGGGVCLRERRDDFLSSNTSFSSFGLGL